MNKFNFMDAIKASDFTKKPQKHEGITLIAYILKCNFFGKVNNLELENQRILNKLMEIRTLEMAKARFLSEIEELKASEYAYKKISINGKDYFDIELERIAKQINSNLVTEALNN